MKPPTQIPVVIPPVPIGWIISREANKIREEHEALSKKLNYLKDEVSQLRESVVASEMKFEELQHFVKVWIQHKFNLFFWLNYVSTLTSDALYVYTAKRRHKHFCSSRTGKIRSKFQ
jgi:hypothetical protein